MSCDTCVFIRHDRKLLTASVGHMYTPACFRNQMFPLFTQKHSGTIHLPVLFSWTGGGAGVSPSCPRGEKGGDGGVTLDIKRQTTTSTHPRSIWSSQLPIKSMTLDCGEKMEDLDSPCRRVWGFAPHNTLKMPFLCKRTAESHYQGS